MGTLGWTVILAIGAMVVAIVVVFRRRIGAAALSAGFLALNALIVLVSAVVLLSEIPAFSQEPAKTEEIPATAEAQESRRSTAAGVAVGAALAAGLAAIGAGIAVAVTGSAAIGAITEKPEMLGRSLIFVGLAEGIAIYGLIIAFMILTGGFGG